MILLGILLILLLVVIFFMGVRESLLIVYLFSLMFKLLWLPSFMELYMLLNKFKRWVLLVHGLNVIMFWFMLHLRLWLMFLECFVIGETLLLIIVRNHLRFLTFFRKGNAYADKLANLNSINREYFHEYNRFPFNLFLEFFINRY